jgi:SpoVK/Ycf46/Vps4 family AAA+-type ATPase
LFAEAEEEEKRMGPNSGLHIIIFDEIDAICKQRGSVAGINDTVVCYLLGRLDQLNNIIVIGTANRKDMIDEALLITGRLEVHIKIPLPNEKGRSDILKFKTNKLATCGKLDPDVDIFELAVVTENFSGAQLERLVNAASFSSLFPHMHQDGTQSQIQVDPDAVDRFKVVLLQSSYLISLCVIFLGNDFSVKIFRVKFSKKKKKFPICSLLDYSSLLSKISSWQPVSRQILFGILISDNVLYEMHYFYFGL